MKPQNSKEQKSPYLDKLLDWYDKSKKQDDFDIKKGKMDFIQEITQFKKEEIKNTESVVKKITIWERIKKTLGIG